VPTYTVAVLPPDHAVVGVDLSKGEVAEFEDMIYRLMRERLKDEKDLIEVFVKVEVGYGTKREVPIKEKPYSPIGILTELAGVDPPKFKK
jgi:hypothetical protein